jgi:hypothetical protein
MMPWPVMSISTHTSARAGRWNQTAWSRLALMNFSFHAPSGGSLPGYDWAIAPIALTSVR